MTTSTPPPDTLEWLPATTHQYLLAAAAFACGLVGFCALLATGRPLRYCVIGVLLTGVAFFVFMALFAHRSVARMTTKAPSLAVALPAANRAEIPAALVERMIALVIVVVLTVLVRNPALPGCALGGGFGLLLTTHLMRRWQEQNHENLVVVRRPHNLLLPERPSFYRMPGD